MVTGNRVSYSRNVALDYNVKSAMCYLKENTWYRIKLFTSFYFTTQCLVPSASIFIFYLRVCIALRKQDKALGHQAEAERARRKSRKKVMWITIVVTMVFYICCGIPQIFLLFASFANTLYGFSLFGDVLVMMFSINSAFNPFVYFLFIQSFRNGFKTVFMTTKHNSNANFSFDVNMNSFSLDIRGIEDSQLKHSPKLIAFVNTIQH